MMYFTKEDKAIHFDKVTPEILQRLEWARELAGVPFVINSHYRSHEKNEEIGGTPDSAHCQIPCSAFDIRCTDSKTRYKMLTAFYQAGYTRIGIYPSHIHVDTDEKKPERVIWVKH